MFLIGGILLIYAKFTDSIFFIFDKLVINFVAEYFECWNWPHILIKPVVHSWNLGAKLQRTEANLQTIKNDHFYDFASLTKEVLLLKKTIHKIRTAITDSRKDMKSILKS